MNHSPLLCCFYPGLNLIIGFEIDLAFYPLCLFKLSFSFSFWTRSESAMARGWKRGHESTKYNKNGPAVVKGQIWALLKRQKRGCGLIWKDTEGVCTENWGSLKGTGGSELYKVIILSASVSLLQTILSWWALTGVIIKEPADHTAICQNSLT